MSCMKSDRPLSNPTIEDFKYDYEYESEEEEIPVLKEQIPFKIDNRIQRVQQYVSSTKMLIKRRAELIEFSNLWRDPALPFAVTTMVLTLAVFLVGGALEYNKIPPRVPIFYNSLSNHWEQFDKIVIFLFPIIVFLIELAIVKISINIFKFDRRLSISIAWIVTFLNILFLISIGQIYTLVT